MLMLAFILHIDGFGGFAGGGDSELPMWVHCTLAMHGHKLMYVLL
jgi:hypothetical protein